MLHRVALTALLVLSPAACAHKGNGSSRTTIHEGVVDDGEAVLAVKLSYEAVQPRQVELRLGMRVSGIVETNKLVAEVYIKGFNVEDGTTQWEGFVPPRQPQKFSVVLAVPEGINEARATVRLSRSQDSEVLMERELNFTVADNGELSLTE